MKKALILISVLFMAGCVPAIPLIVHDEYRGVTTYRGPGLVYTESGRVLNIVNFIRTASIEVNRVVPDKEKSGSYYFISCHYTAPRWMFISPGDSLLFLVDGKKVSLNSKTGSQNSREAYEEFVTEDAIYEASPDDLMILANAKTLKARIIGDKIDFDCRFDASQIRGFQDKLKTF